MIRAKVANNPSLYLPLRRLFTTPEGNVRRDTQLVIEGFPRSGNSFAEAAFRLAQGHGVRLAHHSHAAAQVIQAARWNIPCLVLVREPIAAGISLMQHHPGLFTAEQVLEEYSAFFGASLPYHEKLLFARFEVVIDDFGRVIRQINEKYGTRFVEYVPSEENEKRTFELLNALSRERGTVVGKEPYSPDEATATRDERRAEKQRIAKSFEALANAPSYIRAKDIYEKVLDTNGWA